MIQRIIDYFLRKRMSQPYKSLTSNIGFKAIGKSSDLRTLPSVRAGFTYLWRTHLVLMGYIPTSLLQLREERQLRLSNQTLALYLK